MPIHYDAEDRTFHIQTEGMSYIFQLVRDGYLRHAYWGARLGNYRGSNVIPFMDRSFAANPDTQERTFSLDTLAREYPAYGNTDFREPAIQIEQVDGSRITDLRYRHHEIYPGKKTLTGLPAVYAEDEEAETLEILLEDEKIGLQVVLSYSIVSGSDALMRSVQVRNQGKKPLRIQRVLSAAMDIGGSDFDVLYLPGSHCRERLVERRPLGHYRHVVESRRGASSHQENPFLALLSRDANEHQGEVYAMNLVYSGSFRAEAEPDQFDLTRLAIGINPFEFSWLLEPGESFQAPEAVLVYSASGLGTMSRTFHSLYRKHLCRGFWRDRQRPVLVNNWEATYFDFNEQKLFALTDSAKALGMELLVLDDGWFGHRNDDNTSLGDWIVDKKKLPNGLGIVADYVMTQGMKFGLWFEPEMISPESQLYEDHPDWCLHVAGRTRSGGRNQLVLDLSRADVCEYVVDAVSKVLNSAAISYVKWDMNRHMTEVGSAQLPAERQQETQHRYMLGLYSILEKLNQEFPDVLFESCSGGGGRFDPGMLYYMPQVWTSDDSDAIERLQIQYGTSLVYPTVTMGAHVSAIPNHQVGRQTPLETRGAVAMQGCFGYELDITQLSEADRQIMQAQIRHYKELRPLLQFGDLYRLINPVSHGTDSAWMVVSPDRQEAWVTYVQVMARPNPAHRWLRLEGLSEDTEYRLTCWTGRDKSHHFPGVPESWQYTATESRIFGGDELMKAGLTLPVLMGDYQSISWHLQGAKQSAVREEK